MKKFLTLVLALVMVFVCVSAMAVSSKTVEDVTGVTTESSSSSSSSSSSASSNSASAPVAEKEPVVEEEPVVVITAAPETAEVLEIVEEMAALVSEGESAIAFFPAEVQAEIVEEIKAENVVINEIVPLKVTVPAGKITTDTTVKLSTATKYQAGKAVAGVVGIKVNGQMQWIKVKALVNADGTVNVDLPADVLAMMQANGDVIVAICSEE